MRGILRRIRGRPSGDLVYFESRSTGPIEGIVEVRLGGEAAAELDPEQAIAWCVRQTLKDMQVVVFDSEARELWRVDHCGPCEPRENTVLFFAAPGSLPQVPATHLEAATLILAAEDVDAVALKQTPLPWREALQFDSFAEGEARPYSVFRANSFEFDSKSDRPVAKIRAWLAKAIDCRGVVRRTTPGDTSHRHCYITRKPHRNRLLRVAVSDASRLRVGLGTIPNPVPVPARSKPHLLVTTSFLARGGAEHTLFETLRELRDRFDPVIVTLAPHHPELGDRRPDFAELTSRIYSFGDWVHPTVMVGMISSLIEDLGIRYLYNANGTTLFYDFAPQLRARFSGLRIVDHLYDHRVGYIEQYQNAELLRSIDACIAENHRIAGVLRASGWAEQRVPVIWPCGRRASSFPEPNESRSIRRRIRQELGISADSVVFLTAARTHVQKRPLDLVRLAQRFRDLELVEFVWVGGGGLDRSFDQAIEASNARIRRIPFRTDIPDLIVASDVGCLVSEYEGLPVFMIECLQGGLPFIGTDVGEMGEVLRRTNAGVIVDRPGDINGLELATRKLLEADLRKELGGRAAAAAGEFGVETCAERYAAAWRGES